MWSKKEKKKSLRCSGIYTFSLWENMTWVCQEASGCMFVLRLSPTVMLTDLEIANTVLFERGHIYLCLQEISTKLFKTNHHQALRSIFRINKVGHLKQFWHMVDRCINVSAEGAGRVDTLTVSPSSFWSFFFFKLYTSPIQSEAQPWRTYLFSPFRSTSQGTNQGGK